jgi:hypothetical protein
MGVLGICVPFNSLCSYYVADFLMYVNYVPFSFLVMVVKLLFMLYRILYKGATSSCLGSGCSHWVAIACSLKMPKFRAIYM